MDAEACTPPSYAACGAPDAATTGVPPGTPLTEKPPGTYVITHPGTVIDGWEVSGVIDVEADRVTIVDTRLTAASWAGIVYGKTNPAATGLRILHDTLTTMPGRGPDHQGYDYGIEQLGRGTLDVGYDDISGFKDGVDLHTGRVDESYIHQLPTFPTSHDQDIYVWPGGTGVEIDHNTLIADGGNATAAVYVAPDGGHQSGVTLADNWVAGGAYCVYAGDPTATDIRITGNLFSSEIYPACGQFGSVTYWSANAGNVASGNLWAGGAQAGRPVTW